MKCENCGKEHDGSYGSGRFCSKKCAKSFSSSNKSLEIKQKIGKSVSKPHLHICPKCNKQFWHKGTAPNTFCDNCKNEKYQNKLLAQELRRNSIIKKSIDNRTSCPICGAINRDFCKRKDICRHEQSFKRLIKYLGFDPNKLGSEEAYIEYDRIKAYVYDLYWNQKMTIKQIAELCGYKSSAGSFAILLSKLIKFRSIKEASKISIETGRFNIKSNSKKYHCSWHTTWYGAQVYCRSSYEKDYCIELDKKKIQYTMESIPIQYYDTQLQKIRYAYPDFYLPESNTIIEVKSSWTFDKQNMIDRFTKFIELGYNVDLLYEHKHYYGMSFIDKLN